MWNGVSLFGMIRSEVEPIQGTWNIMRSFTGTQCPPGSYANIEYRIFFKMVLRIKYVVSGTIAIGQ